MKHITAEQRNQIQALYDKGHSKREIAKYIGVCLKTIYNELPRGMYTALTSELVQVERYSAVIAQKHYDYMQTSKGSQLKLGNDYRFIDFCEDCIINRHWSPDAIIGYIRRHKLKFDCKVCTKTLYNYIDMGLLIHITNKDLCRKGEKKQEYKQVKPRIKRPLARSITARSEHINSREEFGHWEMDTVIGKSNTRECLLVLTERMTRYEIILKLFNKTQEAVRIALNRLERVYHNFKDIFKTITVDNGSEFLNDVAIEQSCLSKGNRTTAYYCHPFSSWERGSNENQNGIIRRWIAKGTPLEGYDTSYIQTVQEWLNTLPRKILDYASSAELFNFYISRLA